MRIAVGSDHAGLEGKTEVKEHLESLGHEVIDMGTRSADRTDYPDYAHKVAKAVAEAGVDRGVVVCGTGIGVCIAANKVPGIRAALPYNVESAKMASAHNNANVLCLGGRTMDSRQRREFLDAWLETPYEGGRHQARLDKLEKID